MVACQSCITEYNKREKGGKKNDLEIVKYKKKKSSVENEEKKKEAAQKIKEKGLGLNGLAKWAEL